MLCPVQCTGAGYAAFEEELRRLGWVEGANLVVERRAAEGSSERLPELATELVRLRPDVIVAPTPQPAQAVKNATSEIPVVFSFVADPVGAGLLRDLSRPGGNITGVTTLVPGAFVVETFGILRELLPEAQRVAAVINPTNVVHRQRMAEEGPVAAQRFDFDIQVVEARTPEEVPGAVAGAKERGVQALLFLGDPIYHNPSDRLPRLVAEAGLPAIYLLRDMVQAGGLIAYSPDLLGISRRHAQLVDQVLRGASPAEMPVERPTRYSLVVNLRTARTLGLAVPRSILVRADEVIE